VAGASIELDSRDFERAVADRIRNLKKNSEREEERLAELGAAKMREAVPRLTGETAATIRAEKNAAGGTEIVTGGASVFLVFGTSKMAPRDFARPAIAELRGVFRPPSWH
jgi:hypothetical protein